MPCRRRPRAASLPRYAPLRPPSRPRPPLLASVVLQLVQSLSASDKKARTGAAQAIAKIGKIELPLKQWPDLIDGLNSAATGAGVPSAPKSAAVTALGFLCSELIVRPSWWR